MPTNDERRDVARKLRKLSHGYVTVGYYREAIGMDDRPNLEYDEVTGEPVLRKIDLDDTSAEMLRLADLIEPESERTCQVVPMDAAGNPPYREGSVIYNSMSDGCSECGYPFDTFNRGVPNYCPNCGAKVVDE